MGLMHKLLEQALKNMKERGQDICYLYPYSIPYYRRKGWEIISDKISYEIKDYQLPKNHQVPGDVRRVAIFSWNSLSLSRSLPRLMLQRPAITTPMKVAGMEIERICITPKG